MLTIIVIALIAGVICQIIASWTSIPSIVFLLILGICLGPELLGVVNPAILGEGLETLIKVFVAVILFEAGLTLEKDEIKSKGSIVLVLVTGGAVVTMLGSAFFAWMIGDFALPQAFLFGSLVVVTGPTVIQPLLRRLHIKSDLRAILEQEGVFIDPVGVIMAVFVFDIVLQMNHSSGTFFVDVEKVFLMFGSGLVIGLFGGYIIGVLVKNFSMQFEDNQDHFVLAAALVVYAISEALLIESGLMAAVTSGVVVGNMDIPNKKSMRKFKSKIAVLFISLLFILLSATIELSHIYDMGYKGLLIVVALMFIVRPLTVFISSIHSGLKTNEKMFLSYISPRGIVAASIASLIGIELKKEGIPGGELIQGLVFLTIAVTVVFQGVTAKTVAKMLKVTVDTRKVVIIGASVFGRLMGKLLIMHNKEVCFIDTNETLVQMAQAEGFEAIEGSALDIDQLEETGIDNAEGIIAMTTSNKVNLFVNKLAKVDFDLKNVSSVINKSKDRHGDVASKLNIDMAFGKPLSVFDIDANILRNNYIVVSIKLNENSNTDALYNLFAKDHIVPLIYKKDQLSPALIYRKDTKLTKGGEITLVDFDPSLTDFQFIQDHEKKIIDV